MAYEYALQHKVDLANVLGSGERSKINIYDVKAVQEPKTFKFSRKHLTHEQHHHHGFVRAFSRQKTLEQLHGGSKQAVSQLSAAGQRQGDGNVRQTAKPSAIGQNQPRQVQHELTDSINANPKAEIPHFSIRRTLPINPLLKHIDDLNQFSSTARVERSAVLAKIVNLTLQKFPEFKTLMIGKSFKQAKYILIHYKNLTDDSKEIVYESWPNKSHQKSSLSKEELSKYPSILVLDGSETEISWIEPVLGFNNVSLKELRDQFWQILRRTDSQRQRIRVRKVSRGRDVQRPPSH